MSDKEHNYENNSEEESIKDQVEEILDDAIEEAESKENNEGDTAQEGTTSEKEQLKADLEKEKDKFLRLFAEFENYKRRTSKERIEMFKTASQDVIVAMLPVLDDFDRAINEINKAKDKELLKGVELISNKFRETLRSKGLEQMTVKEGDTFDPEIHEAITQIPAPKDKLKGKVVDVVERGYKLGDRIIRYPKVVTGK
ncbi:nucleotide exchange factor GrpE [Salinimicrobium sediminilitoris]|uniref:nucleotide exchange factor GrpE n=1 Tax=Salinimicrobium sediminilitoris TaxID=2876715 RepID=UPI001E594D28|nr:nucleotide exchange factor GrpE [Salinimicrobium sediminilitoris]MCC8358426.1 nucleotide exchange factor GrpE [Salinimicrobium sediminilitoris]